MLYLYPLFHHKIQKLLLISREQGFNVEIHSGYRSFEEQNNLYAKGRTAPGKIVTKAKGGQSWHNYGLAADIVFKTKDNKWNWENSNPWEKIGATGILLGLEWGGIWKKFKDLPHFQLTKGLKLSEAFTLYKRGGLEKVWEYIDEKNKI